MKQMVDLVLLVYLPLEKQIARLMQRNGYSRQEAEERVAAQMAIEDKMPHADIIIHNDGSEEETARALTGIWEELEKREKEAR